MHEAILPEARQRHKYAIRLNALHLPLVDGPNLWGLIRLATASTPTSTCMLAKQNEDSVWESVWQKLVDPHIHIQGLLSACHMWYGMIAGSRCKDITVVPVSKTSA